MSQTPVLLELDLAHGLLESPPADPIAAFRKRGTPVLDAVVDRLRRAATDERVAGLIAHVGPDVLTAAQVEELGIAVEALAAAGKRTVCWAEAFGETGNGTLAYHLASHFDEVWLQPSGGVALVGSATGGLFLREALTKLGVEPQILARHEYKNAPDTLLRESMGDAQREALQRLTDSFTEQVVATVARRRTLDPDDVRAAIANAPLTAEEGIDRGLVDHLGYRDEVYTAVRRRLAGAGHETTPAEDLPEVELRYVQRWAPPKKALLKERAQRQASRSVNRALRRSKPSTIAVVPVEGGIALGRGGGSPLGGPSTGSDTVCAALRQAGSSDDVAAVVLRVVSPGGSYVASDAIHREVHRLRELGTPVVASMGTVAASGGYFVAMGADEILALPGTITGSIGVFAGKVVVKDALEKIGVNRELVQTGEQATMWADGRTFTGDEIERLDRWLDEVYADFTGKAAEGRGMAHSQLEPLARGRVWTGVDALDRGLIDRFGGLEDAIGVAAKLAGRTRDDVTAQRFPDVSPLARLRPPQHSDAPGASLGAGWLPGMRSTGPGAVAADLLSGGPERLLAELSQAIGLGPGALRLPVGWQRT
jgi:protease-4